MATNQSILDEWSQETPKITDPQERLKHHLATLAIGEEQALSDAATSIAKQNNAEALAPASDFKVDQTGNQILPSEQTPIVNGDQQRPGSYDGTGQR